MEPWTETNDIIQGGIRAMAVSNRSLKYWDFKMINAFPKYINIEMVKKYLKLKYTIVKVCQSLVPQYRPLGVSAYRVLLCIGGGPVSVFTTHDKNEIESCIIPHITLINNTVL